VKVIDELQCDTDLACHRDVYEEIARGLNRLGLNLAFFTFKCSSNSHAARTLEDGRTLSFPILKLYLKYDRDFRDTGIDHHLGNWGDEWAQTVPVRNALNMALNRHKRIEGYVSDRTFVFVDTRERIALLEIGKQCKPAVQDLICSLAPGVEVSRIFWTAERQYHAIMKDKGSYTRVKRGVKAKIEKALPQVLAKADVDAYCQNYSATIKFGFGEMNLMRLIREDV
jgi:hypothetical protein